MVVFPVSASVKPMKTGSRSGYWVVQWSEDWDPSLLGVLEAVPELMLNRRVAITSCDSGPYRPTEEEYAMGWTYSTEIALSSPIESILQLPAPGFDEWYVYDREPLIIPNFSFVNYYDFSPLDSSADTSKKFWDQVESVKPLHVLGDGASNMFVITRDLDMFEKLKRFNSPLNSDLFPAG
jgi:hypothetical protein